MAGPRGMVIVPKEESAKLDGIILPDEAAYPLSLPAGTGAPGFGLAATGPRHRHRDNAGAICGQRLFARAQYGRCISIHGLDNDLCSCLDYVSGCAKSPRKLVVLACHRYRFGGALLVP